jgi:hypothetical protein
MITLTLLAVAAVGLAFGGGLVAHGHTADRMAVSLLRSHDICEEAESPDDWAQDMWWELAR